mmetsp:Transcript_20870/g.62264  ORF Transcript_20870/g.62264 Transcript_20870/m.62264 type:complete len:144 (-) Transcript_20870:30-461(-)
MALLRLLSLAAAAQALIAPTAPRPTRTRRSLFGRAEDHFADHVDMMQRQFEGTSVEGLPEWAQAAVERNGLNVLTFDEANLSGLWSCVLLLGLAAYVNEQQYGAAGAQGLSAKMKEERRRKSGNDADKMEDVDVGSWFTSDDE